MYSSNNTVAGYFNLQYIQQYTITTFYHWKFKDGVLYKIQMKST